MFFVPLYSHAELQMCRSLISFGILLSVLSACSESSAPPDGHPGTRVLSGAGQTDTIGTALLEAVEIEVRDTDGRIARGVPVTFGGCALGCFVAIRPAGQSVAFTLE